MEVRLHLYFFEGLSVNRFSTESAQLKVAAKILCLQLLVWLVGCLVFPCADCLSSPTEPAKFTSDVPKANSNTSILPCKLLRSPISGVWELNISSRLARRQPQSGLSRAGGQNGAT